jgi:hypothetical protein
MNITHHNGPIRDTATHVIHEAIAAKAYEIWQRDGRPENQSDAIWLAAEQELLTGRRKSPPDPATLPVTF